MLEVRSKYWCQATMSIHVAKCRHADPVFCEARVMATEKGEDRVGVGGGGEVGGGRGGAKGRGPEGREDSPSWLKASWSTERQAGKRLLRQQSLA